MHRLTRWAAFGTALACAGLTACSEQAGGPTISVRHLGSSEPLPMSADAGLAVARGDFVCLFDSYAKELACGDLAWTDTVRFGREGKGPGELGAYGWLVSNSSDGVGFVDARNDRISIFTRQGYAGQFPHIPHFTPASDIGSDGSLFGYMSLPTQRPGEIALLEQRAGQAEPVHEVRLAVDGLVIDGRQVVATGATRLRTGDFIVRIASGLVQRLARYSADGSFVGCLRMPELPLRLPDARDIEIFKEGLALFPPGPAVDRAVRKFANQPLTRIARNNVYRTVQMDAEGRVLVLTTDKSPTGTYVEVYTGLDYAGRAHLRGRVLAIQVVDGILVALTEELSTDDVIPKRRFEWYEFQSDSPLSG